MATIANNPVHDWLAFVGTPSTRSSVQNPKSDVDISTTSVTEESRIGYRFKSYRLKGEYEQPWLETKKKQRGNGFGNGIIYGFIVVAIAVSAYINFASIKKIKKTDYCLVLDDSFSKLDPNIWSYEVQTDGFGTGAFDWTTSDKKNVFTDSAGLHIVPTLTTESTSITEAQLLNGFTLNLTQAEGDGTCTSQDYTSCSIASNSSIGLIIPPVRSARLSTKGKKSIKYGKVEVVAKLPKGDWLWPAIWMMPETSKYGPWPASGEIDIMESRGNGPFYEKGGRDTYYSTMHWGPSALSDAYQKSVNRRTVRRTDFSKEFHTFGMQWTEDYIFTYMDGEAFQTLYWSFDRKKGTMWQRGGFQGRQENSTLLKDPWVSTGRANTPFDEPFYLILDVAVGARNGWFPNGMGNKPWVDENIQAPRDFYNSKKFWLPTWGEGNDRGMTIKSVKMWQAGKCV